LQKKKKKKKKCVINAKWKNVIYGSAAGNSECPKDASNVDLPQNYVARATKKDLLATGHLVLYVLQIGGGHHANKSGQSISKAREIVRLPAIMSPATPALHLRP
jgi:hypothetical protein